MKFNEFGKIPRLTRECVVTEKIDGTNASVFIELRSALPDIEQHVLYDGVNKMSSPFWTVGDFIMAAGQRQGWTDPKAGNAGFGKWVYDHREELMALGPGHHFGEWWGGKVQRGYGLKEKRFSLFNTSRWNEETKPACCHVVPVLYQGPFDTEAIDATLAELRNSGSKAAPGFMNPEGVVVYHVAGNLYFKKTLEKDEMPKALAMVRPERMEVV